LKINKLINRMIPGSKGHAFHACMKKHDVGVKIPFDPNIIEYKENTTKFFSGVFLFRY